MDNKIQHRLAPRRRHRHLDNHSNSLPLGLLHQPLEELAHSDSKLKHQPLGNLNKAQDLVDSVQQHQLHPPGLVVEALVPARVRVRLVHQVHRLDYLEVALLLRRVACLGGAVQPQEVLAQRRLNSRHLGEVGHLAEVEALEVRPDLRLALPQHHLPLGRPCPQRVDPFSARPRRLPAPLVPRRHLHRAGPSLAHLQHLVECLEEEQQQHKGQLMGRLRFPFNQRQGRMDLRPFGLKASLPCLNMKRVESPLKN